MDDVITGMSHRHNRLIEKYDKRALLKKWFTKSWLCYKFDLIS